MQRKPVMSFAMSQGKQLVDAAVGAVAVVVVAAVVAAVVVAVAVAGTVYSKLRHNDSRPE